MGVFCWFLFAMEIRMQGKYVTQQCSSHIGISGLRFGWRKWHNYTETFLAHREAFSCKSGYTCFGFASTFFNATWQRRQRTVEDGSGWVGYVAIKMVRLLGSVWAVVVVVFLHALGFACRGLDFYTFVVDSWYCTTKQWDQSFSSPSFRWLVLLHLFQRFQWSMWAKSLHAFRFACP